MEYRQKYINDNVYGGISFSNIEFEIINTHTFQRLRRIKQQGLTSLTYPSSDHTRFSHSLGVLHVMGKITKHLVETEQICPDEERKLRLAALLHDIGHYPLSHLTEKVYLFRGKSRAVRDTAPLFNVNSSFANECKGNSNVLTKFSSYGKTEEDGDAHHEVIGKEVLLRRSDINKLIHKAGFDPLEIGEIITGTTSNQLYHQLMHSSVDADRLDYLLRDSAAAGVNYGLIDLDYLIRMMCVAGHEQIVHDSKFIEKVLAINHKGIHVLEHFLMARYFSYSQITLHKTTVAFETLMKAIIWQLAEHGIIYSDYEQVIDIISTEDYLKFDDNYIWRILNDDNILKDNDMYQTQRLTALNRGRLKILFDEKDIVQKDSLPNKNKLYEVVKETAHFNLDIFAGALSIPIEHIGYIEQKLSIDSSEVDIKQSDKKFIEAPKVKTGNTVEFLAHCEKSLIKEIFNKELKIFRVFYIDPHRCDKKQSDSLRESSRKCILAKIFSK